MKSLKHSGFGEMELLRSGDHALLLMNHARDRFVLVFDDLGFIGEEGLGFCWFSTVSSLAMMSTSSLSACFPSNAQGVEKARLPHVVNLYCHQSAIATCN
uniref:Uncharacterized protein n=1 Tax=Nelumbo nucifera TaxID=4432 RepID=A0A822XUQ6_NELNU|nr:TPA_asm: hypothetical protein HUJ06_025563 [Nelumbo nucifera]